MTRSITCLLTLLAATAAVAQQAETDRPVSAAAAMQREVDVFRAPETFKAALDEVARLAGVQFHVDWDALAGVDVTPETSVTLRTHRLPLQRVLELLLAQVAAADQPVTWRIQDNVVHITARAVRSRTVVSARSDEPHGQPSPPQRRRRLHESADLTFEDAAFEDVVDALRNLSRVDFHVQWRALELAGIERTTPITMEVAGLSMATTLDLIIDDLNAGKDLYDSVYWLVDDGLILITTGRALDRETSVLTFDVADLLMNIPDFVAPRFKTEVVLGSGGGESPESFFDDVEEEDESPAAQRRAAEEELVETIKGLIDEGLWQDGGGKGSVQILGDRMIITQTKLGFLMLGNAI